MEKLLLIYTTFGSTEDAKKIAKVLMGKKLCACVNIFPDMQPMFFWPPKSGKIDGSKEVVMIIKTLDSKYEELEKEIIANHSYETPCIIAMPVVHVNEKYFDWIKKEVE